MQLSLKRILLLAVVLWGAMGNLFAAPEKVSFTANAPMLVAAGEAFRVEFRLNAKPDDDTFEAPDFAGFDVIAGPSVYRGSSVQYINGSVTKTFEYTYTYVLLPQQVGAFTIAPASVVVDGERHQTQPLPVEVMQEKQQSSSPAGSSSGGSGSGNQSRQNNASPQSQVGSEDILLRTTLSRSSVYKGEPVLAAIKLYRRVSVVGLNDAKFPAFNGFWAQELNQENYPQQRETIDGKIYESVVLREYLLYPQQSGTITIEPAEIEAVAQVVVQNTRNRDPFFGNMPDIYNVNRRVRSPKVTLQVKELPAGAPESFSGAVGRFSLTETPPATQLAANSAATYTLRISGSGNLRFLQAPKLSLPTSFEQYDVKTTEQIKTTAGGATGYRQFEYPFIARAEGEYEIAPIAFSYFDPQKREYVTLRTQPHPLTITPDASGGSREARVVKGVSKEEVKLLGEDIRFIKSGNARLRPLRQPLLFSGVYFSIVDLLLLLSVGAYFLIRKQLRESRNTVLVRGKRANKVAIQRFRAAKQAMNTENRHTFYEEMSRALWGYMSDKLNIPVANLTKENVREELGKRGVSREESATFSLLITRCEEAQYAPGTPAQMGDIYKEGVEFISRMESAIKKH